MSFSEIRSLSVGLKQKDGSISGLKAKTKQKEFGAASSAVTASHEMRFSNLRISAMSLQCIVLVS